MDIETHKGRMTCEDEGRDQSEASISQGTQRITHKLPKLEQGDGIDYSLQLPEGINLTNTLFSDFQLPELLNDKFLSFKPPSQWYFIMEALAN